LILKKKKLEAIKIDDIDLYNQIDVEIQEQNDKLNELGFDPDPNMNVKLYWMFGFPATLFFVGGLVFSVAVLGLGRINLGVKRGTAIKIFKCSVISLVVIYAVPEIWDPIAIEINEIGLHMLDPIDGNPKETVQKLWCRMGGICVEDSRNLLDEDLHKMLMANTDYGKNFLADVVFGFFRITMESMMSLMFFITATIRIAFTLIIIITLPLWLVFSFIPPLKKLSQTVISSFIGACLAPPLVSTVLFVGEQNMIGNSGDSLTEWITVLSIAILAQTFLIMLAPLLQSTISQASSIVSTGIQSTSMAASSAGTAAAGAGARAYSSGGGSTPSGGGSSSSRGFGGTGSSPGTNPLSKGTRALNVGKAMAPAASFPATEGLTKTRIPGEVKSH